MPLILPGNVGSATAATGFNVANSLRFDRGSTDFLNKTLGTPTNVDKATFSTWVKFTDTSSGNDATLFGVLADGNNTTYIQLLGSKVIRLNMRESTNYIGVLTTNRVFRDPSAWYHIVVAFDTTQGTDSNRIKLYINGVQETSFSTATYPSQNTDLRFNTSGQVFNIGRRGDSINLLDGYLAETVFIDGQQLEPDQFGEFDEDSGIWKPINVSGLTFGNNGFYLDYEDSGNLGNDKNGGTDLTVNNLTALDQSIDTCTNNFATMNPLSADEMTFSNGNLDVDQASSGPRSDDNARGTIGVNSGKWYWETKLTGATAPCVVGICFDELKMGSDLSGSTGVYAIQNASATYAYRRENGTSAETSGFPNPVANNIMNVAFDADNGKLYLGINGTYYNQAGATGNPATGSNATFSSIDTSFFWLPWIESRGDNQQALMNFGSGTSYSISSGNADGEGYGNFEYSVPSGYYSLCTKNLAEYG